MALSPDTSRRRFGSELRRWREQAGLTQSQLASAVPLSQSQVSAIERGTKGTTEAQVRRFDDVLTTGGALLRRWHDARNDSRGYAAWFTGVVAVEREATEIREYCPLLISGLLQTEEYARAAIRQGRQSDSEDRITELVTARLQRQELLEASDAPATRFIVEEHVLRRPVGGKQVLREQLAQLLDASALPRVTIAVVPMDSETHPGQDGPFLLFTVPGRGDLVYTETRVSGTPTDDPAVVRTYRDVFAELAEVALPPKASRLIIDRIRKESADG